MDELIQQVSNRTGLPQDEARMAAQTVVDFLKQRLPGSASTAIDQALANGQAAGMPGRSADAGKNVFNR